VDRNDAACGKCHIQGSKEKIPASGGFIQHHEQYNELLASPYAGTVEFACRRCHASRNKSWASARARGVHALGK